MDTGWIKIHRKIKDKGWYKNSKYVHLWVHILFRANHEEKEFMFNGAIHKTKRGEFITGRNALISETGIPGSTLEDILTLFEKEGQIRQQKNNRFRLITVLNYEKYQEVRQPADIQPTSGRHPSDTNNNTRAKGIKKVISICRFAPPSLLEVKNYCIQRNKGVDPNKWVNHYEAKGWLIGKNKMVDWKAAVRTWEPKEEKSYTDRPAPVAAEISEEQREANLAQLSKMKEGLNFKRSV